MDDNSQTSKAAGAMGDRQPVSDEEILAASFEPLGPDQPGEGSNTAAPMHSPVRPVVNDPKAGTYFLNKFLDQDRAERDAAGTSAGDAKPAQQGTGAAPAPGASGAGSGAAVSSKGELETRIVAALREIYDPEIPVNIFDMGLIYGVDIADDFSAMVTMTLTTPHCPVAETMPGEVELRVAGVDGVSGATVNLVWDPPWDMSRMSDEARLELGLL